jgi:hypothetical protein
VIARRRLIELAQEFREIAVTRFRRRCFESTAKRGRYARVRGPNFNADDPSVHAIQIRRRNVFTIHLHRNFKRLNASGSFVRRDFVQ